MKPVSAVSIHCITILRIHNESCDDCDRLLFSVNATGFPLKLIIKQLGADNKIRKVGLFLLERFFFVDAFFATKQSRFTCRPKPYEKNFLFFCDGGARIIIGTFLLYQSKMI